MSLNNVNTQNESQLQLCFLKHHQVRNENIKETTRVDYKLITRLVFLLVSEVHAEMGKAIKELFLNVKDRV